MTTKLRSLDSLDFWGKTRLKAAIKVASIAKPEIFQLDELDIGLSAPKRYKLSIPALQSPPITTNLCPTEPELLEFSFTPTEPEIESVFQPLTFPRRAGKAYSKKEEKATTSQLRLDQGICKHGMKKGTCSMCLAETERRKKQPPPLHGIDPFDMIFPILQPPLGDNFDNAISFPPGKQLFSFQVEGVRFLAEHDSALLGDEMGLGKSIQSTIAARLLFHKGEVTSGLILCPKSVLTDWEKKLWEWAPELRLTTIRGPKEGRMIQWRTTTHIFLTTYETLRQDIDDLPKREFDLCILDEVVKIKNPSAGVTQATREIKARMRWGLSGYPLENSLADLISIFAYIKPGLLHYDDAPSTVKQAIGPYFKRRRKSELREELGLPEITAEEVWLELSPAQREAYERAEQEGVVQLNELGDSVTVTHVLALITKLKQICNLEPVSQESSKLEYLQEHLEEICEQGDKALVFSQYPDKSLKFLEPKLTDFQPRVYHGALSDTQRNHIVDEFQESDETKVLLMSIRAGGLGLTLTRANHVFHFDHWWNPSTAAQAEGRVDRITQKKPVFVTSLFTTDTIEERIQDILTEKRMLFNEVIDDLSDTTLTKVLTEEELFGLFNLQKPKKAGPLKPSPEEDITVTALKQLSPQQFETLVAELYSRMGYQVKQTPTTRDAGIDVYARRISDSGTEYLAIQCKHYPDSKVGVDAARSLYGVIQAKQDVTKGVLVTSGEFSSECRDFAAGKRLDLWDRSYLLGLLQKYKISVEQTEEDETTAKLKAAGFKLRKG